MEHYGQPRVGPVLEAEPDDLERAERIGHTELSHSSAPNSALVGMSRQFNCHGIGSICSHLLYEPVIERAALAKCVRSFTRLDCRVSAAVPSRLETSTAARRRHYSPNAIERQIHGGLALGLHVHSEPTFRCIANTKRKRDNVLKLWWRSLRMGG
jgi:hypothetical protein